MQPKYLELELELFIPYEAPVPKKEEPRVAEIDLVEGDEPVWR